MEDIWGAIKRLTVVKPMGTPIPYNYEECLNFFKELSEKENIIVGILGDWDADGVLSTKIFYNFLMDFGFSDRTKVLFGDSKAHGLNQINMDMIFKESITHLIVVDSGTNDMQQLNILNLKGIHCLVVDHHICNYDYEEYPTHTTIVNAKMKGNNLISRISAAYLCYLLTYHLRASFHMYFRPSDETLGYASLITDGCMLYDNFIREIILKEKKTSNIPDEVILFMDKYSKLDRNFVSYKLGNIINHMCRTNDSESILKIFFSDESFEHKRELVEQLKVAQKEMSAEIARLLEKLEEFSEEYTSSILVDLNKIQKETSISKEVLINSTGLFCSRIMHNTNKAVLVFINTDSETFKVSGRSASREYPFQDIISKIALTGGGHPGSAGFTVAKCDLQEFKKLLQKIPEYSKVSHKHIISLKPDNYLELQRVLPLLADYSEVVSAELPQIYLSLKLSNRFSSYIAGKMTLYRYNTLEVRDLQSKARFGDTVLVSPVYKKPTELIVREILPTGGN